MRVIQFSNNATDAVHSQVFERNASPSKLSRTLYIDELLNVLWKQHERALDP